MHISFAIFADGANVSQEGKLNLLGIFDALQVSGFPTIHPRAHLVVRLKGSPSDVGKHSIGFRWVNPAGNELWSSAGDLQLDAAPGIAAPVADVEIDLPVIAVVDLPLDVVGRYTMHVELDGATVTRAPLYVNGAAVPVGSGGARGMVS